MPRLLSALALLGMTLIACGQEPPKREFRAAWIATVSNTDWPSAPSLTSEQQRAEFINILNQHQQMGLNAVVVQIRSVCDALYPSPFEPWATVLTGRQGRAPQPFYDPLQFMIVETRKRGMEFHAWFNPYRAVTNIQTATLDSNHVVRRHPDWLLAQGNLRILDPGLPEVRRYVTRVVMDVVRRYDVDGVHFDDYFYPYPQTGQNFSDDSTFARHHRGITSRTDWRRDNVNLLVRMVGDSIRAAKPWVKFGISPFGIWQNKSLAQPLGSDTRGLESYHAIYADSRHWAEQGWVDYLAPQVYWHIGFAVANYALLVPWWVNNSFGRHLYIGQAVYRVNNDADAAWRDPGQIPAQLRLNRRQSAVQGSIFYNTTSLLRNPLGVRDSIRAHFYATPALRPTMAWKRTQPPPPPSGLTATTGASQVTLRWTRPVTGSGESERVRQFVVYRFDNATVDLAQARAIRAITPTDTTAFTDIDLQPGRAYTYAITALDRLHNESAASNAVTAQLVTATAVVAQTALLPNAPNPFSTETRLTYRLAEAGEVTLTVYNQQGQAVTTLVRQRQAAGEYMATFEAGYLPAGLYFAVLTTEKQRLTRRMLLQR